MSLHEVAEGLGLESLLALSVAVVPEPSFEHLEGVGFVTGNLHGDRPRIGFDPRNESHPQGALGVYDPSRQRELQGVPVPQYLWQTDGPTPGSEQAERDAGLAEGRLEGPHPDVTGECELEAAPACRAVDPRNHDRRRLLERPGDVLSLAGERLRVLGVESGDDVEVGTRTEGLAGAFEVDNGPLGVDDGGLEVLESLPGESVPGGRPVDGNGTDPIAVGDVDHDGESEGVSKGLCVPRRKPKMMDRADSCRRAARDAVADVEPPRLYDVIRDILQTASMTPGVLTLETAVATDPDADLTGVTHRAAGVQLIYEGLRLTRTLAGDPPWERDGDHDADLEILAADILVARGFYLLARTDAAGKAVRTVQSFGRDQTLRQEADADSEATRFDGNLECDVLELAVVTGATASGSTPTPELLAVATDVATNVGAGFPPAAECLPDLEGPETDVPGGETVRTDRATSMSDP